MTDMTLSVLRHDISAVDAFRGTSALAYRADWLQPMAQVFARLQPLMDAQRGLIIHVVAAIDGQGASTVAQALASTAARSGWCKTAFVDATVRDADTLPMRTVEDDPSDQNMVLTRTDIGGVAVDFARLQSANGLMPSPERIREVFIRLRDRYSLVVVDCPSVISDPQSATLTRLGDGVLLVIAAERVRSDIVVRIQTQLEQAGANILGLVLNRQKRRLPRFLRGWV